MSRPKMTPWFNARTHPPVNGGPWQDYDWRCRARPALGVERRNKGNILAMGVSCPHCEWRGLASPPKERR